MPDDDELLRALADPTRRRSAAERLAARFGAEAAFVFVGDPHAPGKLVPAPGFAATTGGGSGWRDMLRRCASPGIHAGEVDHPTRGRLVPAAGMALDGMAIVLVGCGDGGGEVLRSWLGAWASLMARMLDTEVANVALSADLALAEKASRRAGELARALDEARAQAESATRVKDEFLAMLGHELRNPLAPIVTALHLLRMRGGDSKEHHVIERQVVHLMRLVDDLLDVSRIKQGKVELRREVVEVARVVARALEMARPILEEKRQTVDVDVPDDGLWIDADPARIAQVLSNLLTNAAKYSDEGTRVAIAARSDGDVARITVSDEGIGIPAELLTSIFEHFVQTPQGLDRAQGGLGLGLAIVRSLVAMHGGTVRAHSDGPGRGSQVVVELPLTAPPDRAPEEPTAPAAPAAGAEWRRAVRLLVVDDNVDAAEVLDLALTEAGFTTTHATSAAAALARLETFEADVAILDIGLPDMDGYALGRAMRERRPAIALVALTGYGQAADKQRAQEAGFDAHLVKPVEVDDVEATVERVVATRRAPPGG